MKRSHLKGALTAILFSLIILIPVRSSSQWVEQNSGTDFFLTALHFINENTGFIGSGAPLPLNGNFYGGEIIRTTNGGVNWQRVLLDSNIRVKSFYFSDQITGYAVGGSYATYGKIMKTTNAGLNWFTYLDNYPVGTYYHFYNIYFADANTGFASNQLGVFKTINSGINWSLCLNAQDYIYGYLSLKKLHFFDVSTGIYLSDSGKIYRTTDSGLSWSVNYVDHLTSFRDITFSNSSTGFAVGLEGKYYNTTNGGINWQAVNIGTIESLYSISFPTSLTGYITKANGVLKSTDGGITWQEVMQLNTDTLYSTYFIDQNMGYVAGTHGKVFKTITGGVIGINQISTEVPGEFSLEQNYPNPFNPATNIKFAIPKLANVRLTIYDLLGREVESLVNQQLSPGIYEVNWNAAKFSSGIYMYRLVTNDFQMVKKMSLIK
ncbi:MAG: T9SS type A sorting domain-containing protein [Ignavibacteria bacterium]|nr:T9SS type A sorting domain-containing protein [Ignavibacteria bacterium]